MHIPVRKDGDSLWINIQLGRNSKSAPIILVIVQKKRDDIDTLKKLWYKTVSACESCTVKLPLLSRLLLIFRYAEPFFVFKQQNAGE